MSSAGHAPREYRPGVGARGGRKAMLPEQKDQIRAMLLRVRSQMLAYLQADLASVTCCRRCLLPYPEGEYESYSYCPWCDLSIQGREARIDESRKIIGRQRYGNDEIQCGECGGEYEQPTMFPFKFCPHCGAPFADEDELLIELPFLV
jgi:hypothetical protein